jgi:hypothetical protein
MGIEGTIALWVLSSAVPERSVLDNARSSSLHVQYGIVRTGTAVMTSGSAGNTSAFQATA